MAKKKSKLESMLNFYDIDLSKGKSEVPAKGKRSTKIAKAEQPKLWLSVYFDGQFAWTKFEKLVGDTMDERGSKWIGSGTDGFERDIQFEYKTQVAVDRVMKKVNEIASSYGIEVRFEVKEALC